MLQIALPPSRPANLLSLNWSIPTCEFSSFELRPTANLPSHRRDLQFAFQCNTGYNPRIVTKTIIQPTVKQDWVLLVHQLPPRPTNLRVRIWRQLQKLGAVAIKNSVYVLPANDKTHEELQWLKQEIEAAGGEAAVFRAASVEGATDREIIAAFRKARDE